MRNGVDNIVTVWRNLYKQYDANKVRIHIADCLSNNITNFTWNLSDILSSKKHDANKQGYESIRKSVHTVTNVTIPLRRIKRRLLYT